MTYFVASLTFDSVKSCVMQGASCTQRKFFMAPFVLSIPFVLSQGGNISSDSFLPSILLLVVIVVAVVIIVVILVVFVVAIIKVIIVVVIIGVVVVVGVSAIIKLSFAIIGCQFLESSHICLEIIPLHSQMVKFIFHLLDLSSGTILLYQKLLEFNPCNIVSFFYPNRLSKGIHQDRASSVKVPVANFTLQSSMQLLRENTNSVRSNQWISPTAPSEPLKLKAFAMLAAYVSRATATRSSISFRMAA
nr:hypothetical protein [Tanacetum cinerariifolium]